MLLNNQGSRFDFLQLIINEIFKLGAANRTRMNICDVEIILVKLPCMIGVDEQLNEYTRNSYNYK
jgi:hypothetical protein